MKKLILNYLVCPVCLTSLELKVSKQDEDEIIEGRLRCTKCKYDYIIHSGIPILIPPGIKPSDSFLRDIQQALKQYSPKEVIQKIMDGEIGLKRLVPDDPVLTTEEIKQGEYWGSLKFLEDSFGSLEGVREEFRKNHEKNRDFFDSMIKMGRLDKADVILDIGTGSGYILQYIAQKFPYATIFSIDVSYRLLRYVRGRFKAFGIDNVNLVLADANQLPFSNNRFDAVDFWGGKEDIPGFSNNISQAYRILRNNGWFVTDYENTQEMGLWKPVIEEVGQDLYNKYFRKLGFLLTKDEVIAYMKENGYRKIKDKRLNRAYIISGKK